MEGEWSASGARVECGYNMQLGERMHDVCGAVRNQPPQQRPTHNARQFSLPRYLPSTPPHAPYFLLPPRLLLSPPTATVFI